MSIEVQRLDALIQQTRSRVDAWGLAGIQSGHDKAMSLAFEQAFDALEVAFREIRQLRLELDDLRADR